MTGGWSAVDEMLPKLDGMPDPAEQKAADLASMRRTAQRLRGERQLTLAMQLEAVIREQETTG
jgi:hypothetical protein